MRLVGLSELVLRAQVEKFQLEVKSWSWPCLALQSPQPSPAYTQDFAESLGGTWALFQATHTSPQLFWFSGSLIPFIVSMSVQPGVTVPPTGGRRGVHRGQSR